MKKLFAVIAVLAVMLSFAGCGGTKYEVSDYDTAATNDLVQLFIKQRTVTDETEVLSMPHPGKAVFGITPAVTGSIEAAQALMISAGLKPSLAGKLWSIDLESMESFIIEL